MRPFRLVIPAFSLLLLLAGGCGDDTSGGTLDALAGTGTPDLAAPADTTADTAPDLSQTDTSQPDAGPDTEAPDGSTELRDWSAPGPYRVGFRIGSVTYDPTDGSAARTLRLAVWYPTEATTGQDVLYLDLLPAPGVLGAAPPADLGPRPIILFSHGNTSFAEQSPYFTEFFASHGYLVVAPDHTGNTFGSSGSVGIYHWRPDDLRGVLDHLEALAQTPADPLAPLAPLVSDRIAVVGHSFGAYTALAAAGGRWAVDLLLTYCQTNSLPLNGCASVTANQTLYRAGFLDARIDAIIPMTPGAVILFGLGGSGLAQISIPTLLMTGDKDATTPDSSDGDPAWLGLGGSADNIRLELATAGHFTFSDACTLAALGLPVGENDGCGPGFLDIARAHAAINAYALAFTELHLQGDASGQDLLDGTRLIEPDVTVRLGAD